MGWLEQSLSDFTNHLAAKEPVPGGGGAAALIGALAAALGSMAGNYTVGKKAYAAHEPEVRSAIEAADGLRARLLALIDADAQAFEPLSRAYALPRDDPDTEAALQEATRGAVPAPTGIAQCCAELAPVLEILHAYGSRLMQSDVGCAAYAAAAAAECAYLNVLVNLRALPEGRQLDDAVRPLLEAALPRLRAVAEDVKETLNF